MSSLSRRERSRTSSAAPQVSSREGLFLLNERNGQLHLLNEGARQLQREGVPLLGTEPTMQQLRTTAGEVVRAGDLPIPAAARERRTIESDLVLSRSGASDYHLRWIATPLVDASGQVSVLASLSCMPPPPDWQALAGLTHDLRTPLQTISLLSALLEHGGGPELDAADTAHRMRDAAERALRVAADLFEWCSAPIRGGRLVNAEWFALEPFVGALTGEQVATANQKGVILEQNLDEVQGWEICTDEVRLGRLLINLISNAVRYTSSGGRVRVTASWQGEGGEQELVLRVADTGLGISPEEQESIFQPFERGRAGREGGSTGSGLGLAVVERLVDEMGLRRDLSSRPGHGTDFRVLVPRQMLRQRGGKPG